MLLQKARRDRRADFPLDRPGDDLRLMLAKGQHDQLPRLQNRADAHRDRPPRHVFLAKEVARRVDPRHPVERDQSRAARSARARLVEADMPRAADAQELNVDSARLGDFLLVPAAIVGNLLDRDRAVRHMPIPRVDVDEVEQMLAHEPHVALQLVRLHRKVFVEVERDDIRERQALLAMHPHQLVVDADRCAPSRQAQHARLPLSRSITNHTGNFPADGNICIARMGMNLDTNPLDLPHAVLVGRRTQRFVGQGLVIEGQAHKFVIHYR